MTITDGRGRGGEGRGVVTRIRIHKKQFLLFAGHICDDNEVSCLQLAKEGACDAYPTWMLLTCRKSCGNCGCDDLAANCSSLAKEEKCFHDDHVNWMLRNCQRSCKVCLGKITIIQASFSESGPSTEGMSDVSDKEQTASTTATTTATAIILLLCVIHKDRKKNPPEKVIQTINIQIGYFK